MAFGYSVIFVISWIVKCLAGVVMVVSPTQTAWAACLFAQDKEGKVCPHNFRKLADYFHCQSYSARKSPHKKLVCCLLGLALDLQVNKACREMYCCP